MSTMDQNHVLLGTLFFNWHEICKNVFTLKPLHNVEISCRYQFDINFMTGTLNWS
jgi:hypothetical protein